MSEEEGARGSKAKDPPKENLRHVYLRNFSVSLRPDENLWVYKAILPRRIVLFLDIRGQNLPLVEPRKSKQSFEISQFVLSLTLGIPLAASKKRELN